VVKSKLSASIWNGSESWDDTKTEANVTAVLRASKASCCRAPQVHGELEQMKSIKRYASSEKIQINQQ